MLRLFRFGFFLEQVTDSERNIMYSKFFCLLSSWLVSKN